MSNILLFALVFIPLSLHLGVVALVYYDTGRVPLERRRWLLLVGLIPIFGFFMYLFERSELEYDPSEDPYAGGGYNVHPSREDDFPFSSSDGDEPTRADTDERREDTNDVGTERRTETDDDEWGT